MGIHNALGAIACHAFVNMRKKKLTGAGFGEF